LYAWSNESPLEPQYFLPEKSFITEAGQSLGHVCTSTVVVPPDALSPTPLASSAMKTKGNVQEWPYDPEPLDEGDIQVGFSSD
jgi:hypothetical protein